MYITQMYQFKTVAQCSSISKAAEKLHISQPGLSKVINKIEEELDCKCFIRTKNSIQLNDYGKIVLAHIDQILEAYESMCSEINALKNNAFPPSLQIQSSSNTFAPYVIDQFISENTQPIISYCYNHQHNLLSSLEKGTADMVFSIGPVKKEGAQIVNLPLCRETYGVLVSAESSLFKKKKLSYDDIRQEPFMRYNAFLSDDMESSFTYLSSLLKKNNVHLKYMTTVTYASILTRLVEKTSYALLCTNVAAINYSHIPGRKFIRFEDPEASIYLYASYFEKKHSMVEPFLSWITQNYKRLFSIF